MFRVDGSKLFYGPKETDWVGFYSPITRYVRYTGKNFINVVTELGEYKLLLDDENKADRVEDISGKSIKDLQREHYPHLYNEDGTWKRDITSKML